MAKTTRIKSGLIQVDGLDELNKSLRDMPKEMQKKLRDANKSAASFVATDAKAAAYSIGGVAAHVAPSIKSATGATSAGVAGGGPAHPAFGGAEFGSKQYKQFKPWRGNDENAGYFVYPTIRRDADRIETEYSAALDRVIREVGLA